MDLRLNNQRICHCMDQWVIAGICGVYWVYVVCCVEVVIKLDQSEQFTIVLLLFTTGLLIITI